MMARLKHLWIDDAREDKAIRIDWDNDRHQRIEISGETPEDILHTFDYAVRLIRAEIVANRI